MRILHCADLHLDRSFADVGLSASVGKARRDGLKILFEKICSRAKDHSVDAVTIAGDLFDQDFVRPSTMNFLSEQLARLAPIPVLIAPGSSDRLNGNSLYLRWSFPDNVHIFQNTLSAIEFDRGVTIWGGSFPLVTGAAAPIRSDKTVNMLLLHNPAKSSEIDSDSINHLMESMDFALFGGDHQFCHSDHAVNAGSPERLELDESDIDHGVVLITIMDRQIGVTFEKTGSWQHIRTEINLDGCSDSAQVEELIRECLGRNRHVAFFSLILTGSPSCTINIDLLREILGDRGQITLRLSPPNDIDSLAAEPTVRGFLAKAFNEQLEKTEPEAQAQVFNAFNIALQALNGLEDITNAIDPY